MFAAVGRYMTGSAPGARGGDERRYGYVDYQDVVSAIKLAIEPQTEAIRQLDRTFTRELQHQTTALTDRLDKQEARLTLIEVWRDQQEDAEMVRESIKRNILRVLRWLIEHPGALWPVVTLVLGLVWMITGHPPVGVGPIQP